MNEMAKRKVGVRPRSVRVERKREQARQEILEVAQALLLQGGVEAVTLAAVAAARTWRLRPKVVNIRAQPPTDPADIY